MRLTQAFAPVENIAETYAENGINQDIREYMEKLFPKSVKSCVNVESIFKGKNHLETAKLIWLFLRNKCQYRRDPSNHQLIRLPSYFISHKPHQGDCKTFSMFARSVYAAIYPDCETSFKFTAYYEGADTPSHVYVVVKDSRGNEIIIDGCWTRFNNEKKYTFALPLNFKKMRITSLSGIDDKNEFLNGINDHASGDKRFRIKLAAKLRNRLNLLHASYDGGHIEKKDFLHGLQAIKDEMALNGISAPTAEQMAKITAATQKNAAKKKERRKKNLEKLKKGWKGFLRANNFIALAPVRGAYLAVVAMNLGGVANKMELLQKEGKFKKVEEIWKNVGGIVKILKKAAKHGAKHKPIFLSKKSKERYNRIFGGTHGFVPGEYVGDIEGIGIAPAIAAALATAVITMITGAMGAAFKSMGKKGEKHAEDLQGQAQEQVSQDQAAIQANAINNEFPDKGDVEIPEQPQQPNIDGLYGIADGMDWEGLIKSAVPLLTKGAEMVVQKAAKRPKLQKVLMTGATAADDYMTGRYLRQAGVKDAWKTSSNIWDKHGTKIMIGGATLAALGVYFLGRKKR